MSTVPSNTTEHHRQNRNTRKIEIMTQLVNLLHKQDVEAVSLPDSTIFATNPCCLGNVTAAQNNHGLKQRAHTFLPLSAATSCHAYVTSKNVVAVCFLAGGLILSCLLASCIEARQYFGNPDDLQQQQFYDNPTYVDLKDQENFSSNRVDVENDVDNSVNADDEDVEKKSCVSDDGTYIDWKMCSTTLPHTEVSNQTMQILVESHVLRYFPFWSIQEAQKQFPNLPVHKLGHPKDLELLTKLTPQEDKKLNNRHQRISHEKRHAETTPETDFVVENENEPEDSAFETKGIDLIEELEKPQKSLNGIAEALDGDSRDWTKEKCTIWLELQKKIPLEASLMAIADEVKNDCVSSLDEHINNEQVINEQINSEQNNNLTSTQKNSNVSRLLPKLMSKFRTSNSSQNKAIAKAAKKAANICDDPTDVKKSLGSKLLYRVKQGSRKFKTQRNRLITRAMSTALGRRFKPIFKQISARVKKVLDFWLKHGDVITVLLNIVSLITAFSTFTGGVGAIILLGLGVLGFVAHLGHTIVLHRQRRRSQYEIEEQLAIDIGSDAIHELTFEDDKSLHGKKLQMAQGRTGVHILVKIKIFISKYKIKKSLTMLFRRLEKFVLYLGTLFFRTLKVIFKPVLQLLSPITRICSAFNFAKLLTPPDKLSNAVNTSIQSALTGTRTIFALKAVIEGLTSPAFLIMRIISLFWILYLMGSNMLNAKAINRLNDDVLSLGYNHCLHLSKEPDCVTKVANAVKYISTQSRNDMNSKFAFEMMKLVELKQESDNQADLQEKQDAILNRLKANESDPKRKMLLMKKLEHMGFLDNNQQAPPRITTSSVPPEGSCTDERNELQEYRLQAKVKS